MMGYGKARKRNILTHRNQSMDNLFIIMSFTLYTEVHNMPIEKSFN